ncbi:alpha/beta fold hydrolase [Paenibacillus solisilvae]|uniref:Alpha/beta fold hydrolase n=1 Tax=Paenibacillus solisilvae TaxID=2486751 RepID=A0ABW0VVH3_9BACL
MAVMQSMISRTASSLDGTSISYETIGSGPGLVLVHGTCRAAEHYRPLAEKLAAAFTVHVMNRRGRAASGAQGKNYSVAKECEDVTALLRETGSSLLLGHSYGGFVGLEAARNCTLKKLAVYEPAGWPLPMEWAAGFERALERKDELEAFTLFVKGLGMDRSIANIPKAALKILFRLTSARGAEWQLTKKLLHTVIPEIREVMHQSKTENYRGVKAHTLIMAGRKTPDYMQNIAAAVHDAVPDSTLLMLPELNHNAPDLHAPRQVAKHVLEFFTG